MGLIEGITTFVTEMKNQEISFGLIGGLAVFAYGGERTTFDVDFLVHEAHRDQIKAIAKKLNLNVVNENNEVLQFAGSVQVDVIFARREKTQNMLKRVQSIEGFPFPVVTPEDLIGLKIQAFAGDRSREYRDKSDILTLFRENSKLNIDLIKTYADIFKVWNEIEEIRKRV